MKTYLNHIAHHVVLPLAIALGIAPTAYAGTQTGKITYVAARTSDGLLIVNMNGTASEKPQCATGTYWMIKDENSTVGKQQLAILMAAQVSGKTVTIVGTGTCTRWPNGEDIEYVRMETE